MHGQSRDYTPTKQAQLQSLLDACYFAWVKPHPWASAERVFIDCMAGSGHDEWGGKGSPLILQDFAAQFNRNVCVWCDIKREHTERLATFADFTRTTVLTGRYQDKVRDYLIGNVPRNALGLVYLDDNGCREIWNDDGFLRLVMTNFQRLDVVIHFSETAWSRSDGAGIDWAEDKTVMNVLETVLRDKPASVVYAPRNRQNWRLVYGVKSGKMDLVGQDRTKLRDYINYRRKGEAGRSLWDLAGGGLDK